MPVLSETESRAVSIFMMGVGKARGGLLAAESGQTWMLCASSFLRKVLRVMPSISEARD